MAGSGHLQTFKFLKFLRSHNSADGHAGFGTQMAVSLLNKDLNLCVYICQMGQNYLNPSLDGTFG